MKCRFLIGIKVFLVITFIAVCVVFANQAGGSDDPLVAKSYVDEKINQVLNVVNSTLNGIGGSSNNSQNKAVTVAMYTPVLVEVGQTIYGKEGTEIILRSGKGYTIVPGNEGIVNITNGLELKNNNNVLKNNLLIVPRTDGRGIKVTEKAWFLVKGGYEIK